MISGDNLKNNTRNLIFLALYLVIIACLYGLYFELPKNVRDEDVNLALFICANVCLAVFLIIVAVDRFRKRDDLIDTQSRNNIMEEKRRFNTEMRNTRGEFLKEEEIGRQHYYFNNSFEGIGNIWRTVVFACLALFTFSVLVVIYEKNKEDMAYIIGLSIGSIAMLAHVSMLIYQLVERTRLDKRSTMEILDGKTKTTDGRNVNVTSL